MARILVVNLNSPILATWRQFLSDHRSAATLALIVLAILAIFLLPGCSSAGRPMRFDPQIAGLPKAASWFIEGKAPNGAAISCSFVEFDERGDFLDFRQHTDCEAKLRS